MTKLTNDIAFNSIFHKNIIPTMSIIMMDIKTVTIKAVNKSNAKRMKVHVKIAINVRISCMVASCHMVRYCS